MTVVNAGTDWELDFYSRPVLEADGRKRQVPAAKILDADFEPLALAADLPQLQQPQTLLE